MIYKIAISQSKKVEYYKSAINLEKGERVFVKDKNKKVIGYVVDIINDYPQKTHQEVLGRVDGKSFLKEWFVDALQDASSYFNAPLGKLFDLCFPKGIEKYFVEKVHSNNVFYNFGDITVKDFIEKYGEKKLNELQANGVVDIIKDFDYKPPKPRKELYIILKADLLEISKKRLTQKQKHIIDYLMINNYASYSELKEFFDIKKDVILQLQRKGLIEILESIPVDKRKVVLNEEQERVVEEIVEKANSKVLLYGVTGSGKTEVYLSVIEKTNKKVLYLVPEVSLIEQTVSRIHSRLPDKKVGIYHSYLTQSQKVDVWMRAVKGDIDILVGTRSAFFLPHDYELVIIDEAHDESYYQDSEVVYDVNFLAEKFPGIVIFGSATPSLKHYFLSKNGEIDFYKLTKRYGTHLPDVEIIDMKVEEKVTYYLSKKLIDSIAKELENSKSVMLFVRRKGYSLIMCNNCGNIVKCPDCDVALTYHKSESKLKCHICGYETQPFDVCPSCGSAMLYEKGTGTERIEKEIQKFFPARNISRVDTDVIKNYNLFQKILKELYDGKLDILVGTKMITKGLDVPTVSLIGVIDVDAIQNLPDYNSSLNLFRLIVQVIGRSGRKEKGKALIQTYDPDNIILQYAVKQDVEGYYEFELKQRRELKYPPYIDIIQVIVYSNEQESGFKSAEKIVEELRKHSLDILGPTEFFVPKIRGNYLHHFVIKTNNVYETNKILNDILTKFPTKARIRVNPPSLYFT